jgi:uncharacterized protein
MGGTCDHTACAPPSLDEGRCVSGLRSVAAGDAMIHVVRLDDAPPQPWKNGGGSTQELLAWPTVTDWIVRMSVAHIEQDGPFSAFAGIDRWFAVVSGAGVALEIAGDIVTLGTQSAPLHFDGAAAPACTLLNGPTQDLNLMVRRSAGAGDMQSATPGQTWTSNAGLRALYTADTAVLISEAAGAVALPAGACAWSHEASGDVWQIRHGATGDAPRAWWLSFTALTSPA